MEAIEELDLEIRPATIEDFDILTDISRVCFPEELRWSATKSHSRKWWKYLIDSKNCEIWVGSIYEQVIAFIVLVIHRDKYEEAVEKQHYTFLDCLLIFMSHPKRFIKKVFVKLKRRRLIKRQDSDSSAADSWLCTHKKIKKIVAESVPWCGPMAVLPGIRGKGISLKMMEQCFMRARSLGYKEIYTAVQKRNIMSRIMGAIVGFKVINEVDYLLFFKKSFEVSDDTRANPSRQSS